MPEPTFYDFLAEAEEHVGSGLQPEPRRLEIAMRLKMQIGLWCVESAGVRTSKQKGSGKMPEPTFYEFFMVTDEHVGSGLFALSDDRVA